MSSDSDFFHRLFEGPPEIKSSGPKKKNFNIEHFAEWLDEQGEGEESLQDFVNRCRQERGQEEFKKRRKKQKKN